MNTSEILKQLDPCLELIQREGGNIENLAEALAYVKSSRAKIGNTSDPMRSYPNLDPKGVEVLIEALRYGPFDQATQSLKDAGLTGRLINRPLNFDRTLQGITPHMVHAASEFSSPELIMTSHAASAMRLIRGLVGRTIKNQTIFRENYRLDHEIAAGLESSSVTDHPNDIYFLEGDSQWEKDYSNLSNNLDSEYKRVHGVQGMTVYRYLHLQMLKVSRGEAMDHEKSIIFDEDTTFLLSPWGESGLIGITGEWLNGQFVFERENHAQIFSNHDINVVKTPNYYARTVHRDSKNK